MPILNNSRLENFAQLLARGVGAPEAFAQCGYSPHAGNASTYARRPNVVERVREIQRDLVDFSASKHIAEKHAHNDPLLVNLDAELDVKSIQRRLLRIADLAQGEGSYAAANGALKLLGQTIGLFNESKRGGLPSDNDHALIKERHSQTSVNLQIISESLGRINISGDGFPSEAFEVSEEYSGSKDQVLLSNDSIDAMVESLDLAMVPAADDGV